MLACLTCKLWWCCCGSGATGASCVCCACTPDLVHGVFSVGPLLRVWGSDSRLPCLICRGAVCHKYLYSSLFAGVVSVMVAAVAKLVFAPLGSMVLTIVVFSAVAALCVYTSLLGVYHCCFFAAASFCLAVCVFGLPPASRSPVIACGLSPFPGRCPFMVQLPFHGAVTFPFTVPPAC